MIVSGSNDPLVNGTYTYDGVVNGKASWIKGDYVLWWGDVSMTQTWVIENSNTFQQYYSNLLDPSVPAEIGWNCAPQAVAPCTPPVVTTTPLPDVLTVSGCVETQVAGLYTRTLNHEGWPRYENGSLQVRRGPNILSSPAWVIENDSVTTRYYFNNRSDVRVPDLNWYQGPDGTPATLPVVTEQPLPEELIVSGTVDSFLNGIYARGLNYSGYPQYVNADYVIRQGWIVMTSVWSIENDSLGDQYYTHTDIGTDVPETGWELGPNAGSPPSPPVVTETQLPDQYKVSGAGFTAVNGLYTRTVNSNSHTGLVYEKEAIYFLRAGTVPVMNFGYEITNSGGDAYYYVVSNALLIPSADWALDFLGTSYPPPPFVVPYNFPWPMFLPSVTNKATP
ncbi:MAG: hypothetical protein KKA76_15765 [Proteobacteria bacterium]|nr:hypothetical protein [Pseudomonadota bacterium]